ncbi:MAG: class I SAM-dependent DNA methyltransferase, partial [Anaerohalosphaera sp.]|nr:class I SAM-dependent DNA methyltransferase [Anaerohalosphaera sp.]
CIKNKEIQDSNTKKIYGWIYIMPISWNEIKHRAMDFSREWKDESRERAEAQSFWNGFFNIFGIKRRRVASFEEPVKKLNDNYGFIDLFWKGTLLVEHKSRGEDLNKAYSQALDYFATLKEHELPKYVLVSDFERFRLYNLDDGKEHEFKLSQLHKYVNRFGFIAGYTPKKYKDEAPVNIKAAEMMGRLHDELLESGYKGHELEVFLMRLLFCMFADDTGIFDKNIFTDYIRDKTNEDGSDLGGHLTSIFQTMNTVTAERQANIDEMLNDFPYVNGGLFGESLRTVYFNSRTREVLLECCDFDWGGISPAIFGSMFQSVMNPKERRELGAHYTTEKNILKLIEPLFLDELRAEFEHVKGLKSGKAKRLDEFHRKIADLNFFDPACGCGNFLVVTYRELRLLEIEILDEIHQGQQVMGELLSLVGVEQFYGIEIEEFPARIAETAMWLVDHQMNIELSEKVDVQRASLPLIHSAHILNDNALQVDWEEFTPKDEIDYILGNPPFIGARLMNAVQKTELNQLYAGTNSSGKMDYVSCWYIKAAKYIQGTNKKVAFVSTNSICQGEQVGILWNELIKNYSIKINFAHRTFSWSSEARGSAHVHVVIIGFSVFDEVDKYIYEYEDVNCEPHQIKVANINPYLIDFDDDVVVVSRNKPICNVSEIVRGSETTDDGHLMLSEEEVSYLQDNYPNSKNFIRQFTGGGDILNGNKRWCLWLKDVPLNEYKGIPLVIEKIKGVQEFRKKSSKERTRRWAEIPALFSEDRQPTTEFLIIPKVSSERRKYIPIAYAKPDIIINNTVSAIPNASLYYFGIIESQMHMAWMKTVCGRTKSDYQYSNKIVYNNYPWPKGASDKQVAAVEAGAQVVLDERAKHSGSSLADMYDPLTMPAGLVKAHNALDRAVDKCYRGKAFGGEMERLEYLFGLYKEYTEPLIKEEKKRRRR